MIMMKPLTTEKAVKIMEIENTLVFEFPRETRKKKIREDVEKMFNVKVENIRTLTRGNKKHAYIRLDKKNLAIDVATKLGMI